MKKNSNLPDDTQMALSAYVKMLRATDAISERLSKTWKNAGLTISQFGVLEALYHLGPLCQKEIAKKILKTTGNITMVIDNLSIAIKRRP